MAHSRRVSVSPLARLSRHSLEEHAGRMREVALSEQLARRGLLSPPLLPGLARFPQLEHLVRHMPSQPVMEGCEEQAHSL